MEAKNLWYVIYCMQVVINFESVEKVVVRNDCAVSRETVSPCISVIFFAIVNYSSRKRGRAERRAKFARSSASPRKADARKPTERERERGRGRGREEAGGRRSARCKESKERKGSNEK